MKGSVLTSHSFRALQCFVIFGSVFALTLMAPSLAIAVNCTCQAVLACETGGCSPAGGADVTLAESCRTAKVSVDPASGELSICAFGACWTGKANAVPLGDGNAFLHGEIGKQDDTPTRYAPSDVSLLLNNGIGLAQVADDSGVMQFSLICDVDR